MSSKGSASSQEGNGGAFEGVAPLELFFDLVFVFAFTQVTGFLSDHLTWTGMLQGTALLAALWWAWVSYLWLTNAVSAEERIPARIVIISAMAALLVTSLAVPDAFGDDGVLFGLAYFAVRLLQVALYAIATSDEPETRQAILRLAPGFLGGPALLVVAGFLDGLTQGMLWALALAIDYGVPLVRGVVGFHIRASHFVERHGLVVILALGESIVVIGAAGVDLSTGIVFAAFFAIALSAALWWAYFDYVLHAAERNLTAAQGHERARLARDSYSYLHLPMVGGIIFVALGLKETLAHVGDTLGTLPAIALCGGAALYLLGHNAFRLRDTGTVSVPRFFAAALSCALIPVAMSVPALVTLVILVALLASLAAFETVRSREFRRKLRSR